LGEGERERARKTVMSDDVRRSALGTMRVDVDGTPTALGAANHDSAIVLTVEHNGKVGLVVNVESFCHHQRVDEDTFRGSLLGDERVPQHLPGQLSHLLLVGIHDVHTALESVAERALSTASSQHHCLSAPSGWYSTPVKRVSVCRDVGSARARDVGPHPRDGNPSWWRWRRRRRRWWGFTAMDRMCASQHVTEQSQWKQREERTQAHLDHVLLHSHPLDDVCGLVRSGRHFKLLNVATSFPQQVWARCEVGRGRRETEGGGHAYDGGSV
jgi:hypothetical protein